MVTGRGRINGRLVYVFSQVFNNSNRLSFPGGQSQGQICEKKVLGNENLPVVGADEGYTSCFSVHMSRILYYSMCFFFFLGKTP